MVLVSYSGREINAKLVYYGPGLSGKTTNLEFIYSSIPQGQRGKMVSMKTKTERTLFFDFLPVHLGELSGFKTRFLLYTVPGQVYYNATRKLVLKGVDAVVFVADSKRGKMDENVESLENLKENLKDLGLTLDKLPWVIQYNKRDLSDTYTRAELEAVLNPGRVPAYEGVASTGVGVVETFKGISRLLLRKLARDVGVPVAGSTVEAEAGPSASPVDRAAAPAAPAVPDAPVTVYAAAPIDPAWAPPAPTAVPDAPITAYATDSSWTANADAGPSALRFEAEPLAVSEDRSSPPGRGAEAAAVLGTQFPPVAEPVRIPRPGSDDTSVWSARGDGDDPSEHHVSVGERLRRWLSRSPEPEDAVDEGLVHAPEIAEPLPRPEPKPIQPVVEPVAEPAAAVFKALEIPDHPLAAEPLAISQTSLPEAVNPEAPTAQAGVSPVSTPLSPVVFPPAASVSFAMSRARATPPAAQRRRPREIIVPLELSSDDLAEGVVLKVAIRMQQVAGDAEDEAEPYAA